MCAITKDAMFGLAAPQIPLLEQVSHCILVPVSFFVGVKMSLQLNLHLQYGFDIYIGYTYVCTYVSTIVM